MKKQDLLLAAVICMAAAVIWIGSRLIFSGEGSFVRITVDGGLYGVYSLQEDQEVTIGDTNKCRIEGGKVWMTEASCPDHLCIGQGAAEETGESIVCLPNKVVIEIVPDTDNMENTGRSQ